MADCRTSQFGFAKGAMKGSKPELNINFNIAVHP